MENELIISGANLLNRLLTRGNLEIEVRHTNQLIFLTGRPEHTRRATDSWLKDNLSYCISDYFLNMRRDGDYRPSPIVKGGMLKGLHVNRFRYDMIYFIDDDPENVKAVCREYPFVTGITFGTNRMEEKIMEFFTGFLLGFVCGVIGLVVLALSVKDKM